MSSVIVSGASARAALSSRAGNKAMDLTLCENAP